MEDSHPIPLTVIQFAWWIVDSPPSLRAKPYCALPPNLEFEKLATATRVRQAPTAVGSSLLASFRACRLQRVLVEVAGLWVLEAATFDDSPSFLA